MANVSTDEVPITGDGQLLAYFSCGEAPREAWVVGTEYEKLAIHRRDQAPVHYEPDAGKAGIRSLLEALNVPGTSRMEDAGELVGVQLASGTLTLEPGGQFELSGAPLRTIHAAAEELAGHCRDLEALSERFDLSWAWAGAQPVHGLDAIGWMPKRRYQVMREYLPMFGRRRSALAI